ncbi:MAG: small multi-drug export protein [Candidatus Hadarchaeum sp.]|uniref:COG2426 family protein n=1 Tax=Candidatus Hadarchaeum sp. TaxID=2883567 RepID=UPI00316B4A67
MMGWLSFLLSLVPFLEVRFSLPLATIYNPGLPPLVVFAICLILNLLAIPLAYLLLDIIVPPIRRKWKLVNRLFQFSVKRAQKYQGLSLIGLALFVGVPFPGTGAYSGVLIAYVAGFNRKTSSLAIAIGVFLASVIMLLAILGIVYIQGVTGL